MRTVYVLMYWSDEGCMTNVPTGERTPPKLKPYAVFEDAITAERMKRDGDEIIKVPFFRDDCPNHLVITDDDLKGIPLSTPHTIPCDYRNTDGWGKDSTTLAPFPPPNYPKVTCSKTVDEHSWTNRVD